MFLVLKRIRIQPFSSPAFAPTCFHSESIASFLSEQKSRLQLGNKYSSELIKATFLKQQQSAIASLLFHIECVCVCVCVGGMGGTTVYLVHVRSDRRSFFPNYRSKMFAKYSVALKRVQ